MNLKKITKIASLVLVTGILVASLIGCTGTSSATTLESQAVTIQRGDLTVEITSAGNLALSRTQDLAFATAGTVKEVRVKEGDSVQAGDLLASLDTSQLEEQLTALQNQLTSAQRKLTAAERQLPVAERQVPAKERALLQAELNLEKARITLETFVTHTELDEVEREIKKLQVEIAEASVEDARLAIEDAKTAIEDTQLAIEDTRKEVADAQQALEEAKALSPLVTALFTGFITKVNVSGGEEVKKGTVAMTIADPNKFEANIMISEKDIFQVKTGGEATVQVDAMSSVVLPAKVTAIAPTATVQSGVVNYAVKVEVQPLAAVTPSSSQSVPSSGAGQFPSRPSGRQTAPSASGTEQGAAMTSRAALQLREGLTITVNIQVQQKKDVLLAPNGAITRQGLVTRTQVLVNGLAETREIKTGISNWQYTEVTEGLSEGDRVIVTQGTTSNQQQQIRQGGMFIPGVPGVR
ncbi:MAG: HlyD family efflux transporter periplasmic adaptor subunit [Dehalococcoidales bacterium]|nr:HlyD family efflux transporter periplasmic adaptor subunit [Dehalococcoidales bacterium]